MNTLFIDTSDNKKINVGLNMDGKLKKASVEREKGAQLVLVLIKKLLEENNLRFDEISKIEVKRGPGSFTGLRVGISIANALSFALSKSINNKDLSELETPVY